MHRKKIAVVALLCAVVALAACRREEYVPLKLGGPAAEQPCALTACGEWLPSYHLQTVRPRPPSQGGPFFEIACARGCSTTSINSSPIAEPHWLRTAPIRLSAKWWRAR